MNWYKQAQIIDQLEKEAGLREGLQYSLMGAIIMIFLGSGIATAAKRWNISEEKVTEALRDESFVNKAREIATRIQTTDIPEVPETYEITPQTASEISNIAPQTSMPIEEPNKSLKNIPQNSTPQKEKGGAQKQSTQLDADNFIDIILKHENLIQGQTPFRYTNDAMRRWDSIHNFKIDKTPRHDNRRNFIFLENPADVPLAVKKQFNNYLTHPSKFGLGNNPTIENAIEKFDQTGAYGKKSFLKKYFPHINFQAPLATLFSS